MSTILAIPLATILIAFLTSVFLLSFEWSRQRRVQSEQISKAQWIWETGALLRSVLVDTTIYLAFRFGLGIQFDLHASWMANLLVFALMIFWFDLWFYCWHRLFHRPGFYPLHNQHHRSVVTTPITAHSFSLIERVILNIGVMLPVYIAGFWHPMPLQGHLAYLYTILVINTYGHCNVEFLPPILASSIPFRWLNTPTSHSRHHIDPGVNFSLIFVFLDSWFGTGDQLTQSLHAPLHASLHSSGSGASTGVRENPSEA